MRHRLGLLLYVSVVIAVSSIHDPRWLGLGLLLWAALAGRQLPAMARRAALAILVFNSMVSASYMVLSLWQDSFAPGYLLLMNLRVFLLTASTFLFAQRVNLLKALGFSKGLLVVLTLAWSQIRVFRRLLEDFGLGLRSRSLHRPSIRVVLGHGATTGSFFVQKALHDASEMSAALESRGFFHDRG